MTATPSTGFNSSFLDSKTNQLLLMVIGICLLLIIGGIIVQVIFDTSVFDFVALGVGAVTGNGGIGAIRNTLVDGPVRQQYAALDVAKQAQENNLAMPTLVDTRLTKWTPPIKEQPNA